MERSSLRPDLKVVSDDDIEFASSIKKGQGPRVRAACTTGLRLPEHCSYRLLYMVRNHV